MLCWEIWDSMPPKNKSHIKSSYLYRQSTVSKRMANTNGQGQNGQTGNKPGSTGNNTRNRSDTPTNGDIPHDNDEQSNQGNNTPKGPNPSNNDNGGNDDLTHQH